ncbi:FtsX-like permease family protein [Lactobacillus sp. LC28-10]|uniref:FtsX-like permease family protein n=1 Tax=Secundilactobacillus angelensis TaxID=2722706 RepID=A0ABX1KXF5_9LACO|nr:FtsX-like permease family protein [Secundilactobacillus angelensis]MCH5461622.1 ABC transporter permease [Secundilactobacillus angelensis]NLR17917.1 FtsX-like permease family protein [Secundilactobacillus angelensis]
MKPMTKNMWREIAANKGRFIAIILIILLGALIFVGVKAAGPSLNDSLDTTVKTQHLSDVQLFSTTGFTPKDVTTAEKVNGARAEISKFKYVTGGKNEDVVALYGYQQSLKQNQLKIRSGHLPHGADQIVLDERAKQDYGYRLGDTYRFNKQANLKQRTYQIVGFADSPRYIDYSTRGSANVGDGTVRYFAYLQPQQLKLPAATMLSVRFRSLQDMSSFNHDYQNAVAKKVRALKIAFKPRAKERNQQLSANVKQVFAPRQQKLTQASKQLAQMKQVTGNSRTLQQQQKALIENQKKLNIALQQATAKTRTTYTWQTREDLPGFTSFGDTSDRIAAIANVFPVFFFLIAALITFTTITRMVEEARRQIGTFKALGYTKWTIARNYLSYALMAGLIGAILGSAIGNVTLPRLVISMYHMTIPLNTSVPMMWAVIALAVAFSLLATVGAAVIVVRRELAEKPADLMRPRAPKSAKRILMERIAPLWRRLSFNQKVSYRNLFRYKSRMWMTIIGIAGGTALILTGFGLNDSISSTATQQYGQIFHYSATVSLAHDDQSQKTMQVLNQSDHYRGASKVNLTTGKVKANADQIGDVNLVTPKNQQQFKKYVTLSHSLNPNGVVICKKIASQLGVKAGDQVSFTASNGQHANLKVTAVTPNYMGVFAYMSPAAYRNAFNQKPTVNTLFVKLTGQSSQQQNQLARQLLKHGGALGTSFASDQKTTIKTMSSSMNVIVLIMILLSGVLSFVVLYNLTNINISERIRELSTVKVLGFFDNEVTMYVSRENILLTVFGIILGYGAGWGLLSFILNQATTSQVVFPVIIRWPGYVVATLLMVAFTLIVMWVTHQKLKHVDMVEALKEN